MGHHITALVTAEAVDPARAAAYELPCFRESGFTIVGLHPYHSDFWAEQLGIPYRNHSAVSLDNDVTRYFARQLGLDRYALISTDYHGGTGTQRAIVYENEQPLMPATAGGINAALRLLGVRRGLLTDEFDTLNLGRYRSFDDYFERYYDFD